MQRDKDILEEAVDAWKGSVRGESLSAEAKSSLFQEIQSLRSSAPFVPGLTRAWRWAFLGSVPVVALASVLMIAGDHRPAVESRLAATKVDGMVVFTLANGRADHLLYRSTDPQSFNPAGAVKMARNQYSENATGGPTLVFYRID